MPTSPSKNGPLRTVQTLMLCAQALLWWGCGHSKDSGDEGETNTNGRPDSGDVDTGPGGSDPGGGTPTSTTGGAGPTASGDGDADSSTGGQPPAVNCEPVLQRESSEFADVDFCENDSFVRREPVTCDDTMPVECAPPGECGSGCTVGRCSGPTDPCECVAPCGTDDDCGDGFACQCSVGWLPGLPFGSYHASCIPANCRTADDCGGFECGLSDDDRGCGGARKGYFCHSEEDECFGDRDCVSGGSGNACVFVGSHWACQDILTGGCD